LNEPEDLDRKVTVWNGKMRGGREGSDDSEEDLRDVDSDGEWEGFKGRNCVEGRQN
jgi:hypothetical protein